LQAEDRTWHQQITNISSLFILVTSIPIVEELYFRGYLLPRLSYLGGWAIMVNSLLFALYHFTTPWALVSRTLITLPLAYVAYLVRKGQVTER
jgi:membrane protease YdiL (CAAX protease family)